MQHIYNQKDDEKNIASTTNEANIHMDRGNDRNNYSQAARHHARLTLGSQTEPPTNKAAPRPMNEFPCTQSQSNLEFEKINDQKSNDTFPKTISINPNHPSPQDNTLQNGHNTKSDKTTLNASAKVFVPKGPSSKTNSKCKVLETITEQDESHPDVKCPDANYNGVDSRHSPASAISKLSKGKSYVYSEIVSLPSEYSLYTNLPCNRIDVNPYQMQRPQMPPVFNNIANVCTRSNGHVNYENKSYKPATKHIDLPKKLKGIVMVPFEFTNKYIPKNIVEEIYDVYNYMDKSMSFNNNKMVFENTKGHIAVIINFGFHDDYKNELFCVMEQDNSGKKKWRMKRHLYQRFEIQSYYDIAEDQLPSSYTSSSDNHQIDETILQNTLAATKWSRVPIYAKKRTKVKQRRVLHITNQEFMKLLKEKGINYDNIIAIISVNENAISAENVIIVHLTDDASIGISYKVESSTNTLKIIGIYLDKNELLTYHQLSSPEHKCHCLDDFESNIDELKIGNVYDNENKIKALQKENKTPIMKYIKQVLKQSNKVISDNIKTALLSIKKIFNFDTIKQAMENCMKLEQNHPVQSQLLPIISSDIPASNVMDVPMQYPTSVKGNVTTKAPLPTHSAIT